MRMADRIMFLKESKEALMNLHIEIRWSSLLEMNTKTVLWRSGCIKKEVPMMC